LPGERRRLWTARLELVNPLLHRLLRLLGGFADVIEEAHVRASF